jgi:O-antigen ligase
VPTEKIASDISESVMTADGGRAVVLILCAIVVISVLLFGAVDTGTIALLAVLFSVLVFAWFWYAHKAGRFLISLDMIQLPLVALGALGIIQLLPFGDAAIPNGLIDTRVSAAISFDPYATRFFLARLFFAIVFFATALTFINNMSRLRTVVTVLIAFAGLLAFYSILQRVEDPSSIYGMRQPGQAIPFGTYVNRHHFAALMEMTLGLTLGLLFAGRLSKNRWPFVIAAAVAMAIAVFLTGSRGGMIGLFAAITAVAFLTLDTSGIKRDAARSTFLRMAAGVGLLIFAGATVVFIGGTDPLLRSTGIEGGTGDLASGRIEFWKTAIKIFLDHPIIGVGLDAFGVAYSKYDVSSGLFRVEQAHNDYLQIMADGGIIGLACVLIFLVLFARKSLRTIQSAADRFRRGAAVGAFAGCFAVLVHSAVDFPLRTPANGFVFLLLAAIAIVPIASERNSRRRAK